VGGKPFYFGEEDRVRFPLNEKERNGTVQPRQNRKDTPSLIEENRPLGGKRHQRTTEKVQDTEGKKNIAKK